MSIIAGGTIVLKSKRKIPKEILKLTTDKYTMTLSEGSDQQYTASFDGNWRLSAVIESMEFIDPYIKWGMISYWSEEGDANAEFKAGRWEEEWQEMYYPSDLPTMNISDTERVKELLNAVVRSCITETDKSIVKSIKSKFTDREVRLYGLEWVFK